MIHFACYTSVYQQIVTCDCSLFCHNDSLCYILGQATYRTWWKTYWPIWPTYSVVPYSSLFPLHWRSSTPIQPFCLTSVLAESIWEHSARDSHPASLGFPDSRCPCLGLHLIHRLLPSHVRSELDYASCHSSWANSRCRKCVQVHSPHQLLLDGGHFVWFGRHLILVFIHRSFAAKGGGKCDLSDTFNAAAASCWKFDLDAAVISSVSKM